MTVHVDKEERFIQALRAGFSIMQQNYNRGKSDSMTYFDDPEGSARPLMQIPYVPYLPGVKANLGSHSGISIKKDTFSNVL